jgi:hypothetical protein
VTRASRLLFTILICAAGLAAPRPAAAQTREDSAAVLLDAARRFEAAGRLDVADALYDMILERYGDTAAAADVRAIRAAQPVERAQRSGAVEVQVWGTLYGLWLGVGVPLMMGAESPEPYGLGLLVGGPTGFLFGRAYARSRGISEGQARAITWGGTWGTWQGAGWALVLDLGRDTEEVCPVPGGPCFDSETGDSSEEVAAAAVGGGLAGMFIGALLSHKPVSSGLATTVNLGSLWGTWFGLALSLIADLEDDDLLAGTLVGGDAGLLATAVLAPSWQLSRNRARLISIAGVVGGLGGAGLDLLIQPDDEDVAIAIPLLTSVGGLIAGAYGTRNYDRGATGGGDDGGGAGALLRIDGRRLTVDLPRPIPTLLPVERAQRRTWRPAIGLTLVHATF